MTPPTDPLRAALEPLFVAALAEAGKAMRKFPQPNYVISKVAEEAGEVVKAAIHCAEGRETAENVIGEIRQTLAMLIRLYVEGDQVHGLEPLAPRAALAAAPQPAPAPAADERAEIERIICDAFTCDLRGRGDEDGAFWQTAADAMLAAGYRKADALLAERDALIHDIERAKASETAMLAERDAARAEGYRQGQENMRSRIASPLFLRPLVDEQSAGEWYEETLAADTQMYADAILAVPLAPEGSS